MKKIINDPTDFVDETIEGILLAHSDQLRAASSDQRVLVRASPTRAGKVGIVTGGGSGHLPLFLGYVGQGLLDGVAIGNVFSSPSATQIAVATRAVDGGAGVLYLYGNYGGDVYNFDLAGDLMATEGIRTTTVLGTDDVASAPESRRKTRRGVAGLFFAFKIAGAAAERGDDLDAVTALARRTGNRTRTMGVGLSPTILPAAGEATFTLATGEMEVGIGIHGEPGIERLPLEPADSIADRLLEHIVEDRESLRGARVAVLVNGMGATPLEELYVLYRRVAAVLNELGATIHTPFVGEYVTSLEMAGASISVLILDDELTELLDAPVCSPFFQNLSGVLGSDKRAPVPQHAEPAEAPASSNGHDAGPVPGEASALSQILLPLLDRLPAHAEHLRTLDAALGDGDLGITVAAGSAAAKAEVVRDPSVDDDIMLQRVGFAFAGANPSTFAALVGGGIVAASKDVARESLTDRRSLATLGRAVAASIADRGGAQLGDKTILDALIPSVEVLESATRQGAVEILDAMVAVVDEAIVVTTGLRSGRGRAAWLRERSIGHIDPGMAAYRVLLVELRGVLADVGDGARK